MFERYRYYYSRFRSIYFSENIIKYWYIYFKFSSYYTTNILNGYYQEIKIRLSIQLKYLLSDDDTEAYNFFFLFLKVPLHKIRIV